MKKIYLLMALALVMVTARAQYTTIYENSFRNWAPGQGWVIINNDTIPQSICQVAKSDLDGVFDPVTEVLDNMLGFIDTTRQTPFTPPYIRNGLCDKAMITPPIQLSGTDLHAIFYSYYTGNATFTAYVISNPTDTTLAALSNPVTVCSANGFNIIHLNQWAGTTIRLGFRMTGTNIGAYIDNLKVLDKTANADIPDSSFRAYLHHILPFAFVGYQLNYLDPDVLNATTLTCNNCGIQSLEGLQYFPFAHYIDFSNNQITYVPPVPFYYVDSIKLTNNLVGIAPPVPLATALYYENNLLHHIPEFLPRDVNRLQFRNNTIYDCLRPCNRFVYGDFTGNAGVNFQNSFYYYMSYDIPYSQSNDPAFCKHDYSTIYGTVYFDVNNNGVYDTGDQLVPNQRMLLNQGGYVYSYQQGNYQTNIDSGNFNLAMIDLPSYLVCTNSPFSGHLAPDQSLQHNFRIIATSTVKDLGIKINAGSYIGSNYCDVTLTAHNYGTVPLSGVVKLNIPPGYPIASINQGTVVGDTLIWPVTLDPFESKENFFQLNVSTLLGGDSIKLKAYISAAGDANTANNVDSTRFIKYVPHDPNSKVVNTPHVAPGFNDYLTYEINFENTGQGYASRVKVRDYLSGKFDFNSLQVLGASHPYTISWAGDSLLEFVFYPIQLSPNSFDSIHSRGHIWFRIKPLQAMQTGDYIENRAAIYFDNEAAIYTPVCLVWAGELNAGFTYADTLECGPTARVSFTDVSPGLIDNTRRWLFPGGTPDTSIATKPTIRYNTAGTYTVTLIETGRDYSDTVIKVIHVVTDSLPNATIRPAGPIHVCWGDSVVLNPPVLSPGSTYRWAGGSTAAQFINRYTGSISVTVTDALGCTAQSYIYMIVGKPAPVVSNSNNCANPTAHLAVNPTFAHYLWSTGDTTNAFNLTHYGNVTVTVTDTLGCTGIDTFNFAYNPAAMPVILGDSLTCEDNALTLSLNHNYTNYRWSQSNATASTLYIYMAGAYSVTVTTADGCTAADTVIHNVIHGDAGFPHFGSYNLCYGQSTTITNQSFYPSTYLWNTGETTATITASTEHSPYSLTVTNSTGCVYVQQIPVGSQRVFNVQINANDTAFICPGANINLGINYNGLYTASAGCNNLQATLGTGTTLETNNNLTAPGLLSNYKKASRGQVILRASELFTLFGGPALITQLALQIGQLNSAAPLTNFSIKVATTTATTSGVLLPPYLLTEVYNSASYTPVAGWNTFNLTAPFYWDGASNLIVDFCSFNPTTQGNLANKLYCTSTNYYSYSFLWDSTDLCGAIVGSSSVLQSRPNIRFGYCNNYGALQHLTTPNITWSWYGGTATVDDIHALNTPATADSVVWFVANVSNSYGCHESDTIKLPGRAVNELTVNGSDTVVCGGAGVQLCATPGISHYLWSTTATTPCINTNTPGAYNVIATDNGGCTGTGVFNLGVHYTDTVHITADHLAICPGDTVHLCATGNLAQGYHWNNGQTATCISTGTQGLYTIVNSGSACVRSDTINVQVYATTPVTITATNGVICPDDSVTICAPAGGNYVWGNQATTQCINVTSPGNYSVVNTDVNSCTVQSNQLTIGVSPAPIATATGNVVSTGNSGTYQWYLGDTPINGATGATYTATQTGDYKVLVNDNGCSSYSNAVHVIVNGVADISAAKLNVRVYPNPFSDVVTIDIDKANGSHAAFTITNILGQQLYTEGITNFTNHYTKTVDMNNLPDGIYLVTVKVDGGQIVERVVKGNK